jgi:arginase
MITLLSAPSNLGLRPPRIGSVPGTAKAPESLREAGLFQHLLRSGAHDAGTVLPGRYVDDDDTRAAVHVRNETGMVEHARRLANRLDAILDAGETPLVVGGDCSILLGIGLALSRRGRTGLVHLDGHTDFRHPGNSDECASVAGEDLAAAVGLHWPTIADIDGYGPYFRPENTAHIGHRADDAEASEARRMLGLVVPAHDALRQGPTVIAAATHSVTGAGYWLQLDVDVLDPSVMPAVDSPDPGGFTAHELTDLLDELAPGAVGVSVTVFDPDLDPDGRYARLLTEVITVGLARLNATP